MKALEVRILLELELMVVLSGVKIHRRYYFRIVMGLASCLVYLIEVFLMGWSVLRCFDGVLLGPGVYHHVVMDWVVVGSHVILVVDRG